MELLVLFGPPAVGKMTVGREVVRQSAGTATPFRLFHNHLTIEPLLEVFEYGTPPFLELLGEFRRRTIEVAAREGVNLVLTFLWDLDSPDDLADVRSYVAPYLDAGARLSVVELAADLDTRLVRNRTAQRLDAKPSKRDVEWSDANVRATERYTIATTPDVRTRAHDLLDAHPFLRLDTVDVPPAESAAAVLTWLAR